MKIGEYEQMMAYLTRPGFKDGTEKIVEPPKVHADGHDYK